MPKTHRCMKACVQQIENKFELDSAAVVQNPVLLLRTTDGSCDKHTF